MTTQLNVQKILLGAFVLPWHYRGAFLKALIIPLLFLVTFEQLMSSIKQHAAFGYWMHFLLQMAVITIFSVTCHRLVLISPQVPSSASVLRFGRREMRFLYWIFAFAVVFIIMCLLLIVLASSTARFSSSELGGLETSTAFFLAAIPILYVLARLSVIFPAIATDTELSLKSAWKLTANNGWRLLVIVVGLPMIITAISYPLYLDNPSIVETIVLSFINTGLNVIQVVAISLAYQELIKPRETDRQ
jgi:hypothetical protein